MKEIIGLNNKVLEVNLSDCSFTVIEPHLRDTRFYLGGKGMVLKLLYDKLKPGTDPLGEDNHLIIHTGAYMGTGAPCSGRFSAASKSPLTGIIASSSCGGPFGMALKTSGWDGLVIKGKAERPTWLSIDSKEVKFHHADHLWGLDTVDIQEKLKPEGSGIMAIGPAGENLVRYANIISGHRFFGRAGLGAVMGSKNLKAVVAKGKEVKIIPKHPEDFKRIRKSFLRDIEKNEYTSKYYRNYGTASSVNWSEEKGMLNIHNFQDGTHPDSNKVSGQEIERKYTEDFSTCKPCTIKCGHKGKFRGKSLKVPEYETIGMLGTGLGIFNPEAVAEWNETCKRMGMDTISSGSTLAWVIEASGKKMFDTKLQFGSEEFVNETLLEIGMARNQGVELGMGTRWLSEKYGGKGFAIQVKGLETAAYDPRGSYGHGLAIATANRGACHLSSNMMIVQAFSKFSFRFITIGNPFQVVFFEDIFAGINSLHTCSFTAYSVLGERKLVKYIPRPVIRILNLFIPQVVLQIIRVRHYYKLWQSITGIRMNQRNFRRCGKRIHVLERYMNVREGISSIDDTLPDRFLSETRRSDKKGRKVPLQKMIKRYYWHRGFDKSGKPSERTLRKLNII